MTVIKSKRKLKILLCASAYLLLRKRKYWVHPLNVHRNRDSEFQYLAKELERHPEKYFQYFRMEQPQFERLLKEVGPLISPKPNCDREPLGIKMKLVITLRQDIINCSVNRNLLLFLFFK